MAVRTNEVELQVGDKKQAFEINHAERILKMPNNGGWHLPENSDFELDKKNGLIHRENKGANKKPIEKADNK